MIPKINTSKLRYFPVQKHWRRLRPLFESDVATSIWKPNIIDFAVGRAQEYGFEYKHRDYSVPAECDACDWRFDRRGPMPAYWDYACHSACHWVVDLCLYVASMAYPSVPWRIVTHNKHSTVWNGDINDPVLFDVNFSAIGVPVNTAWKSASAGRMLSPGKFLHPNLIEPSVKKLMQKGSL